MASILRSFHSNSGVIAAWSSLGIEKPPELTEASLVDPETGFVDLEKVRVWRDQFGSEVTRWQDRVWSLLFLQRNYLQVLIDWKAISISWLNVPRSRNISPHGLFEAADWFEQVRRTYDPSDWNVIFPEGDPVDTIQGWINFPGPLSLRGPYRQISRWLDVLKDRVQYYPQKFSPEVVNERLESIFGRVSPIIAPSVSEMFGSRQGRDRASACLVEYVFFKALGIRLAVANAVHLGLDEEEKVDAFLVNLMEKPVAAVALVMALDDHDWSCLIGSFRSSGCITSMCEQYGVRGTVEKLAALLVCVGKHAPGHANGLARKFQFFRAVLNELDIDSSRVVNGRPKHFSVFSKLDERLVGSFVPELDAILYWSYTEFGAARELTEKLFKKVERQIDLYRRRFLVGYLAITDLIGVSPARQIELLRLVLLKMRARDVFMALRLQVSDSVEGNRQMFILTVATPPALWEDQGFQPSPLRGIIKGSVAFDPEPELLREYLETLSAPVLSKLVNFDIKFQGVEGVYSRFDLNRCLEQLPLHEAGEVDRDVLSFHGEFIRQVPPLVIYAGTKHVAHGAQPYFMWLLRALPVFTSPQAKAFFAAMPHEVHPLLVQVIENTFGTLGGFSISHASGVQDDVFIALMGAMSEGQKRVVFAGFEAHWEKEFAEVGATVTGISEEVQSPITEERRLELVILLTALKSKYRLLLLDPLPRLFYSYRTINPEAYLRLAQRATEGSNSDVFGTILVDEPEVEGDPPLSSYLICYTPLVIESLSGREMNPTGGQMERLPLYGICDDSDLEAILGGVASMLTLGESFRNFEGWAKQQVIPWLTMYHPDVVDKELRAESMTRDWVANLVDPNEMLDVLLEGVGELPPVVIDQVLGLAGIQPGGGDPKEVLLSYIRHFQEHSFLGKFSRYLDQADNLEEIWARLPWKQVSKLPEGIDLFNLQHVVVE